MQYNRYILNKYYVLGKFKWNAICRDFSQLYLNYMAVSLILRNTGAMATVKVNQKVWNHAKSSLSRCSSHCPLWKVKDPLCPSVQQCHDHHVSCCKKKHLISLLNNNIDWFDCKDATEVKYRDGSYQEIDDGWYRI